MCQVLFYARYYFVVPPKANAPQLQTCISAAGPRQMFPDRGLQDSLCPSAYHSRPVLILTTPSAPTSHGSALLSAYIVWCKLAIASTRSLLPSHNLMLLSACPQGHTLPRQEPKKFNKGEHKVLPLRKALPRHLHVQVSSRKPALQTKPWVSWQVPS